MEIDITGKIKKKEQSLQYKNQRDAVIKVFSTVLNTSMALDACKIQGKLRSIILTDSDFVMETRAIKAKKYIKEIEEIDEMLEALKGIPENDFDIASNPSDVRGTKNHKGQQDDEISFKDTLILREKLVTRRRELLALTSGSQESEEQNALNIFFIPLTKEEFEQLEQVEVNEGTGDGASALQEATSENPLGSNRMKDIVEKEKSLYREEPDGTIVEL